MRVVLGSGPSAALDFMMKITGGVMNAHCLLWNGIIQPVLFWCMACRHSKEEALFYGGRYFPLDRMNRSYSVLLLLVFLPLENTYFLCLRHASVFRITLFLRRESRPMDKSEIGK